MWKRYLADLQTILNLFERHSVALVSVTQFLDSSNTYGRLVLNLITSFAQYERELIGERIREKRAATRRQGIWHGNTPPLGYTLVGQRVVIEPKEAKQVKAIFTDFASQRPVTGLLQEWADRGIKTKRWRTQSGQSRGGRAFERNSLYALLNNRVYLGELFYDNAWRTADHEPIISPELWASTHALMKSRARRKGVSSTHTQEHHFLLKGLIVGLDGRAMTPWLSSPYKGRRYPYYVPQKDIASGAGKSGLPRLAAHQVHRVVWHHLRTSLRDPEDWFKGLPPALTAHPTFERHLIADRLRNLESVIDLLFPELKTRLFRQLVQQVVVEKRTLLVRVSTKGIIDLILELLDEDYLKALELKFEKKRNDVE